MKSDLNGELIPVGGGDPIRLLRPLLTVGRRESCDICMHFPNISGQHCELTFREGYWYVRDLNSTNGIKVNGTRVQDKVLLPDDELIIGKRKYTIRYTPPIGARVPVVDAGDIMGKSLLEKAGLERRSPTSRPDPDFDFEDDDEDD